MAFDASTIHGAQGSRKRPRRVGRGNASGRGTSAGKGTKGQRARTGGRSGTKRRGFKQSLQKIPKLRGFHSPHRRDETISIILLDKHFQNNDQVTPHVLKQKGMARSFRSRIKIVATGAITKKLDIRGCHASKKAIELIEKAGGTITV